MNQRKTMPQSAKAAVTVLNIVLVLLGLIAMLVLAVGTIGAKSNGTFGLFGRSYHLNQSEQMSPMIEKNDLVTIRETAPTSFQMGDLIAYYHEEEGKDYLIIRKLVGMVGSEYYLEDGDGVQTVVNASETWFLGKVESRSPKLGTAVQFLQSKEGKKIYLWWTVSLLFLLIGIIMLLHVILKNVGRQDDEDDEEDYGVEYLEAEQNFTEETPVETAAPVAEDDFFIDTSAFAAAENEEPVSGPEEIPAEPAAGKAPAVSVTSAAAPVTEEEDFNLERIISDIQAKLDSEEQQ